MNLRKKLMTGALVSVMAVALSTGWGSSTASATTDTNEFSTETLLGTSGTTITVNYGDQTLTVSGSKQEVMTCVPKVKTSKTGDVTVTETTWDVYEASKTVVVDLSTLSTKATSYLMVKTYSSDNGETEPLLIQFNAISQSVKAAYDVDSVSVNVTCTAEKVKGSALQGSGEVMYRTANGSWVAYGTSSTDETTKSGVTSSTVDLSGYQQTGATLYFREAASTSESYAKDDFDTTEEDCYELSEEGGYDELVLSGTFASAEAKVKITKKANGPSATVNYDTRVLTIKKNCEYRTSYTASTWKGVDTATSLDLDEYTSGLIEVRTPAQSGKKAASKITRYAYSINKTAVESSLGSSYTFDQNSDTITLVSSDGEAEVTLDVTTYKNTTDEKKQVKISLSNTGDTAYQLCVVDKSTYESLVSAVETGTYSSVDSVLKLGSKKKDASIAFTVKSLKAVTSNGKTQTVGAFAINDEDYLLLRTASVKASGTYAGTYTLLGQYKYTTTSTDTSDTTDNTDNTGNTDTQTD